MSAESITAIVPVSDRAQSVGEIVEMIERALDAVGRPFSILLAVDGDRPELLEEARSIVASHERRQLIALARSFGEGGALRAGLREARGEIIVTHPAYLQVEPDVIPKLLQEILDGADLAFASRKPGHESWFTRFQRWAFNVLMRRGMWVKFTDASCGVRAARHDVLRELTHTDSFHRFLPIQAAVRGYDVREVPAAVHTRAPRTRIYSPGFYLRRFLDIANVFFLTRFLYKPLRFFGLIGSAVLGVGILLCAYLTVRRLAFAESIGDRPALLLGVLAIVVGFQLLALGLLGELIAFTHAGKSRPYRIREVVRHEMAGAGETEPVETGTERPYDAIRD